MRAFLSVDVALVVLLLLAPVARRSCCCCCCCCSCSRWLLNLARRSRRSCSAPRRRSSAATSTIVGSSAFFSAFAKFSASIMKRLSLAREHDGLLVGRQRRPARRPRLVTVVARAARRAPSRGRTRSAASAFAAASAARRRRRRLRRSRCCWSSFVGLPCRLPARPLLGGAARFGGVAIAGIGRHLHVELECRVVLDEPHRRERQVLRVVRDARDRVSWPPSSRGRRAAPSSS